MSHPIDAMTAPAPLTLKVMQEQVHEINQANGWYDDETPRSFGDDVALLHTEVSEMFEAFRDWGLEDQTPGQIDGVPYEESSFNGSLPKPEGVGSEVADVLIRLLDTCQRYDIDLQAEYERKLAYNRTRGYRHGNKRI